MRPTSDQPMTRRYGLDDRPLRMNDDADGEQEHRQDVAADAGERAAEPLDAVAEDAGEIEVDAGGEDDRRDDQEQADELVLAPGDRPAQLAGGLLASAWPAGGPVRRRL